jgi:putative ABC transport system substrate-binding protein
MTNRRIARVLLLVLILLAAALAAHAQPAGKVYRIGFLGSASLSANQLRVEAFRQGLRELGYVEGRNIVIEYRWAEGNYERLPGLAKKLVSLNLDLIVSTGGNPTVQAASAATKTIPIVFLTSDPVAAGVVLSLARPGGNLTGLDVFSIELDVKRLGLLKEALPGISRVAVLWNPANPSGVPQRNRTEIAAQTLGVRLQVLEARLPSEIDTAFAVMARERPDALLVVADPMLDSQRKRIVELAARNRLPGIYQWREFAESGGLISYGADLLELYRRVATYVDRVLKGARPADLPVEQPTKYELVINLKTARALGLTIPQPLLLRADQVIQ